MSSTCPNPTSPTLIVGLGNPGEKYEGTRHNAGFDCLDVLAQSWGLRFSEQSKFLGSLAKQGSLILLKPSTFMNRSGASVSLVARYYQVPLAQIYVLHDELDLPAGTLRLKQGGGHGRHNGLGDITKAMGAGFKRLRLGIGRPAAGGSPVIHYVLAKPDKAALAAQKTMEQSVLDYASLWLFEFEKAQQAIHTASLGGSL